MNKIKSLILFMLCIHLQISAQNTFKAVVQDSITSEKLVGVTEVLQNTVNGTSTEGAVELKNILEYLSID